ncbi:MAG TPA: 3-carboxy-cis,cis-muconate cycloisomerase, partial [Chloroflexota bacterium]|nr:3-carboxy-cis,cis-muconate cycloisomerase [Chloroflexota bacterium]
DEHRVQCYLDIEAALARAQAALGLIPQRAADEITAKCTLGSLDMARLKTQTEVIGFPVLPVVQQLVAACADRLGEYCHWGATTQDITSRVPRSVRRNG